MKVSLLLAVLVAALLLVACGEKGAPTASPSPTPPLRPAGTLPPGATPRATPSPGATAVGTPSPGVTPAATPPPEVTPAPTPSPAATATPIATPPPGVPPTPATSYQGSHSGGGGICLAVSEDATTLDILIADDPAAPCPPEGSQGEGDLILLGLSIENGAFLFVDGISIAGTFTSPDRVEGTLTLDGGPYTWSATAIGGP